MLYYGYLIADKHKSVYLRVILIIIDVIIRLKLMKCYNYILLKIVYNIKISKYYMFQNYEMFFLHTV